MTKKREVQCIGFVKKTPKAAVIIPATVKNNGVLYRVTSIRKNAFFGQSTLKKITVQSKLVSIGDKAFSGIHNKAVFRCKTKVIRNNTKKLLTKKKGFRKTMKIK